MYRLGIMTLFTFFSVRAFTGSVCSGVLSKTAIGFPMYSIRHVAKLHVAKLHVAKLHDASIRSLTMRVKKSKGETMRAIAPLYVPKTGNQELYVKYLEDDRAKIVLGVGPAGSGKTLFACAAAITALRSGTIQKIVMTRPVVPVEEDIGFLPGSMLNKMDPWTRPIFDILGEFYAQKDIDSMVHSGIIDIVPLAYMRGRTFKRAFIIADEMQNSSPNQMLMIATRIGDESRMVITGDLKQSDRGLNNGLADLLRRLKKSGVSEESIKYVELELADVQRSPIVRRILDIYADEEVDPRDKSSVDKSSVKLDEKNISSIVQKLLSPTEKKSRKPSNDDAAMMPLVHISKNMDKPL